MNNSNVSTFAFIPCKNVVLWLEDTLNSYLRLDQILKESDRLLFKQKVALNCFLRFNLTAMTKCLEVVSVCVSFHVAFRARCSAQTGNFHHVFLSQNEAIVNAIELLHRATQGKLSFKLTICHVEALGDVRHGGSAGRLGSGAMTNALYSSENTEADRLEVAFRKRWAINIQGGNAARWARRRVQHWMLLQRLGLHRWVRVPLFFGSKMYVLTGETTSRGILAFGYGEVDLTALMLRALRPGMCFVDVGAHLGYEALLAAVLVGPSGHVITFEPNPEIFPWTQRNVAQYSCIRAVETAVGDCVGTLDFNQMPAIRSAFSGQNPDASARSIRVPISTLDTALYAAERPVHFIKVDVEGAEMSVLRGASTLLREDHPLLMLEAAMPDDPAYDERIQEFRAFLEPLGYRPSLFAFDGALRIDQGAPATVGHANVVFIPP